MGKIQGGKLKAKVVTKKNSASADGGLAPRPAHAGPSARTPIGTSGIFPAHVSAE